VSDAALQRAAAKPLQRMGVRMRPMNRFADPLPRENITFADHCVSEIAGSY
jgi:hypothetical protein